MLTEEAASEILKDQRVLSCYIRNCRLRKGIHCRAGDPSSWKLCPWLPAAETEGATWEPCLDCGCFPKSQHGLSRAPPWLYTWMLLAGTAVAQRTKGLQQLWAEMPGIQTHQRHLLTLWLSVLCASLSFVLIRHGPGEGCGTGVVACPLLPAGAEWIQQDMVPHPHTAASFCMATQPGHPTETSTSSWISLLSKETGAFPIESSPRVNLHVIDQREA